MSSQNSDFEIVIEILSKNPGITARELAQAARKTGLSWGRTEANSVLYKMLSKKLVEKKVIESSVAPIWKLLGIANQESSLGKSEKFIQVSQLEKKKKLRKLPFLNQVDLEIQIQGI